MAGQSFDFDIGESSRGSELLFADGAEVKRHTSNRNTLMDMAALGVELGATNPRNPRHFNIIEGDFLPWAHRLWTMEA